MKNEWQDRIDAYLLDRMSDKERLDFEQELLLNGELNEQFIFTKDLQKALKSRNEKLAAMNEWKDDYEWQYNTIIAKSRATGSGYDYSPNYTEKEFQPKTPFLRSKFIYWISGIAALLVVGLLIIIKPRSDYNFNNITFPIINEAYRGSSEYSNIESLIEQRNFNEALTLIEKEMQVLDKNSYEVTIKDSKDELLWLKVQVLVGLNRKREALSILKQLCETEGKYYNVADSIYNLINKAD